jgi:riboflavin kinase/FMN adenylyltransferase
MFFMWIEYGLSHLQYRKPKALAIGAFDGVHLGHQALIRTMVKAGESQGIETVVMTFNPLPRQVFHTGEPNLLTTLEERLVLISTLKVDGVIVLPFNRALMTSPAGDFIAQLVSHVNPSGLWVGSDFRFGKDREGDLETLVSAAKQYGFTVHIFHDIVCWNDVPVHSSRIRRALLVGRLDEVNGCLGHPYTLTGRVVHGDKRGRMLGFPTANLVLPEERMLPANGVYIAQALLESRIYMALVNVGTRPTFNHHQTTVEAYLLDFSSDIYGAELRLEFLHLLRPELKFPNAEALVVQMREDEDKARFWFQKQ